MSNSNISEQTVSTITFMLDGKSVSAGADESLWEVAKREGTQIPHLCHVELKI